MTLKEYIDILNDYAGCYGEDVEIVSFAHENTITPFPTIFL
jgi:hypothetical protein